MEDKPFSKNADMSGFFLQRSKLHVYDDRLVLRPRPDHEFVNCEFVKRDAAICAFLDEGDYC